MKKLHEKLYNTPEFIKLFILFFLLFYFVDDIMPQNLNISEVLIRASIMGVLCALLTAIYMRPRYKEKKKDSSSDDKSI